MDTIIAASRNQHKIEEMGKITAKFGMKIVSRDDAGVPPVEIEETGETFRENSYIKAKAIMDMTGKPTIADDSGLMVECLEGAPGVYSARFAGEEADDKKNLEKLLDLMEGVPYEKRKGAFVSCITLLFPNGEKIVAEGICEGYIIDEVRGENGFGYDPVFIPLGYDKTFGQLDEEIKNRISHRAKALEKLHDQLEEKHIHI